MIHSSFSNIFYHNYKHIVDTFETWWRKNVVRERSSLIESIECFNLRENKTLNQGRNQHLLYSWFFFFKKVPNYYFVGKKTSVYDRECLSTQLFTSFFSPCKDDFDWEMERGLVYISLSHLHLPIKVREKSAEGQESAEREERRAIGWDGHHHQEQIREQIHRSWHLTIHCFCVDYPNLINNNASLLSFQDHFFILIFGRQSSPFCLCPLIWWWLQNLAAISGHTWVWIKSVDEGRHTSLKIGGKERPTLREAERCNLLRLLPN